jgi:CBS domain containing-hemolysin-like protein
MREASFTVEYKKTSELMVEMRQNHISMILVLDEYGDTVGLITLEDLLEEIVGEIRDEFDEDEEENSITIYGDPSSFGAIQKHLEENGFEVTGAEFTRIPNDLKEVTAEQRETIDKMVEKLEDFDDVQTVYTNMKPE